MTVFWGKIKDPELIWHDTEELVDMEDGRDPNIRGGNYPACNMPDRSVDFTYCDYAAGDPPYYFVFLPGVLPFAPSGDGDGAAQSGSGGAAASQIYSAGMLLELL